MFYLESLLSSNPIGLYLLAQTPTIEDLHLIVSVVMFGIITCLFAMLTLSILLIVGISIIHYTGHLIGMIYTNLWRVPDYLEQQKADWTISKRVSWFGNNKDF